MPVRNLVASFPGDEPHFMNNTVHSTNPRTYHRRFSNERIPTNRRVEIIIGRIVTVL